MEDDRDCSRGGTGTNLAQGHAQDHTNLRLVSQNGDSVASARADLVATQARHLRSLQKQARVYDDPVLEKLYNMLILRTWMNESADQRLKWEEDLNNRATDDGPTTDHR